MDEGKTNWLPIVVAPVVAVTLLFFLRMILPPGMAVAISVTTGMAVGQYLTNGRVEMFVVPISISLALGAVQFFPGLEGYIALLFVGLGIGIASLLRRHWPAGEKAA